jgi:hypothetical protein
MPYQRVPNLLVAVLFLTVIQSGCGDSSGVNERRTKVDYAHAIRHLADVTYPDAEKIVLVQDNLNTHKPASLYAAFPPDEARRLIDKLEIHYTPKHGSWLNMAEIELGILSRQCLDRRIPDRETLTREVAAWQSSRNTELVVGSSTATPDDKRGLVLSG